MKLEQLECTDLRLTKVYSRTTRQAQGREKGKQPEEESERVDLTATIDASI